MNTNATVHGTDVQVGECSISGGVEPQSSGSGLIPSFLGCHSLRQAV